MNLAGMLFMPDIHRLRNVGQRQNDINTGNKLFVRVTATLEFLSTTTGA